MSGDSPASSRGGETATAPVVESRYSFRNKRNQSQEDEAERQKMIDRQMELRKAKADELRRRLLEDEGVGATSAVLSKKSVVMPIYQYPSYSAPSQVPTGYKPNRVSVDLKNDSVWIPIGGKLVPFHVRTIKNISKTNEEGKFSFMRVNFYFPGFGTGPNATGGTGIGAAGASPELFPPGLIQANGKVVFLKELSIRVQDGRNMQAVVRMVKEMQKRVKQQDAQREQQRDIKAQPELKLSKDRKVVLRDVNVRPQVSAAGRSKAVGTLEAHETGFRYIGSRGEVIDIVYENVKHAIYQPCENDLVVLIHLHLKDPILIAGKKVLDVQFYTETRSAGDDLNARRRAGYDPDEILDEQREMELIEKLNKLFKGFVRAVEETFLERYNMDFDIPYRELGFKGTVGKNFTDIYPCRDCVVALTDWPPFVATVEEIDIAYFERISFGLRNFDMVFVYKDFSRTPYRISSVPMEQLPSIKSWLNELSVPWYEGPTNMNWTNILKEIFKDKEGFVEGGGWEGWFGDAPSEAGEEGEDGQEGGAEDRDDDDSEMDDSDYRGSSDEESEEEVSDEDAGSDEEDGAEKRSRPEGADDAEDADAGAESKSSRKRSRKEESDSDEYDSDEESDDSSYASESDGSGSYSGSDVGSDESEGLSWDELERRAAAEDKKIGSKHTKPTGSDKKTIPKTSSSKSKSKGSSDDDDDEDSDESD